MADPVFVALWELRQSLYSSLHERLAGTEGTKELAELQSTEEALGAITVLKTIESMKQEARSSPS